MGLQSLIIKDENFGGGGLLNEFSISFEAAQVTAADIIKERVRYEVQAYHNKTDDRFTGLIQPTDTEAELNGYKMKRGRRINVANQVKTALHAFDNNGFFMLIDDRQVEALDEVITIRPEMDVVFLKLTPLVGG